MDFKPTFHWLNLQPCAYVSFLKSSDLRKQTYVVVGFKSLPIIGVALLFVVNNDCSSGHFNPRRERL